MHLFEFCLGRQPFMIPQTVSGLGTDEDNGEDV